MDNSFIFLLKINTVIQKDHLLLNLPQCLTDHRQVTLEQVAIGLTSFYADASRVLQLPSLDNCALPGKPCWILSSIWQMSGQQSHRPLCHPIFCKSRLAVQHCRSKSHPSNCVKNLENRSLKPIQQNSTINTS